MPDASSWVQYEHTWPTTKTVKVYVRPSASAEGWFAFEDSPFAEHVGPREEIAARFVQKDRDLIERGFKRIAWGNPSGDKAFDL